MILEIDVQGADQVRAKRPHAVLVFLAPPSEEELGRRLRMRHTPEVSFHYDEGLDATDRVARLLDRVRSEERGGGDDGD